MSVEAVMEDTYLDRGEVAELAGIAPESVSRYLVRGDFPQPDRHFGRSPVWLRSTVERWKAERPGRGAGGGRPRKAAPEPVKPAKGKAPVKTTAKAAAKKATKKASAKAAAKRSAASR